MASPAVLSPSFFNLYDDLEHDAAGLEDSSARLQVAKAMREASKQALAIHQKSLRSTRALIKEQTERIDLVSKHWFYGTTLLQPQLWWRGGCQGKIERARAKLNKAQEQDLPVIIQTIHQAQTVELPQREAEVQKQLGRFELSANAASEREVLRQQAFREYPSPQLLQLQHQEDAIQKEIKCSQREATTLEDIIAKLFEARKIFDCSTILLDDASKHNNKFESLKNAPTDITRPMDSLNSLKYRSRNETLVADGTKIVTIEQRSGERDLFHLSRDGKIISTNFPCPNRCGFLVTWHETYCCAGCKSDGGGEHGSRCDRKAVVSQQGAQQKLLDLNRRQNARVTSMNTEDDTCNRLFSQARQETKRAERMIFEALNAVDPSIHERYSSICTRLVTVSCHHVAHSPHGGCACSKVRADDIRYEAEGIAFRQATLSQQLLIAQQLQTAIRQVTHDLETRLRVALSRLQEEQDRVFDELRIRAQGSNDLDLVAGEYSDPVLLQRPPPYAPHVGPPASSAPVAAGYPTGATSSSSHRTDVPMATATLLVDLGKSRSCSK